MALSTALRPRGLDLVATLTGVMHDRSRGVLTEPCLRRDPVTASALLIGVGWHVRLIGYV